MAQQALHIPRNLDPYCDYRMFKSRIGGKIACIAVGNGSIQDFYDNNGEITGIAFQKVDEGAVKPVLENNNFSEVNWTNAPTSNGQRNYLHLDEPIFAPTQKWHEFTNLMLHVRDALIRQMTPQNGQPPATLYDGLHSNVWIGGINNSRQATSDFNQLKDIRQIIGQHWVSDECLLEMVISLLKGFCDGGDKIGSLLNKLLDVFVFEDNITRRIKQAPAETNKPLEDGVVHCLVYGYNPDQLEMARGEQLQDPGRLRHRVLLRKAMCNRSRSRSRSSSRSRSPSPVNDIQYQVENRNPNTNNAFVSIGDMLQNPDDYMLLSNSLHLYFEPHKPDLMIYNQHANGVTGKTIIEISSYNKFGSQTSFATHLKNSTEQCVKKCLAALSHDQNEISGLIIVPDGMKLVKIERQNNPNVIYTVGETSLIGWNETHELYALLRYLQNAIA